MESHDISKLVELTDSLVYEQTGQPLKPVEKEILHQLLTGKKNDDIEISSLKNKELKKSYIQRRCIPKLWKHLSTVLGRKVYKRNLPEILQTIQLQQKQSGALTQSQRTANGQTELNSHTNPHHLNSCQELSIQLLLNRQVCAPSSPYPEPSKKVLDDSTAPSDEFWQANGTSGDDNANQTNNSTFSLAGFVNFWYPRVSLLPWLPLLLAFGVCSCLFGLSWLAGWYGVKNHLAGNLPNAQMGYKVALKLNPLSAAARYNLGSAYEDEQDYQRAHAEYQTAIEDGFVPAYNNQARLDILAGKYEAAVSLLQIGLPLAKHEDIRIRYSFLKNLGWARLEQGRLESAKIELEEATKLQSDRAPAYCLMAQVLEHEGERKGALVLWGKCLDFSYKPQLPEEDKWLEMASQRLNAKELKR